MNEKEYNTVTISNRSPDFWEGYERGKRDVARSFKLSVYSILLTIFLAGFITLAFYSIRELIF